MKKLMALLLALAMVMGVMSFASADMLTATVAGFGGDVKVTMDGTVVGRLVAGEVSRQIAQYIQ